MVVCSTDGYENICMALITEVVNVSDRECKSQSVVLSHIEVCPSDSCIHGSHDWDW
jgi:hypothetical protein